MVNIAGAIRIISKRLEIFHNGEWGTVCDDFFDDVDARVACRQLGYNTGFTVESVDVDDGTGEVWLDDMNCTGIERELSDCPNKGWGMENCGHHEDIGIECFDSLVDGHIRLVSGAINIVYNGTWGTVCDDYFDDVDAQVACRQLGYK
ncbi:scavenger receptor cysteine-rich domain-containing group B protein-like [Mytilus trossulus]|uniref:scavenger receptor cysteine-rich domain-containing group B protein-like n=1 Tax=Mytilus trossulus TaxID=6551 RepID=UPI0030075079